MEACVIRPAQAGDYEQVERIMKQVQALHVMWRADIYKESDLVLSHDEFSRQLESGLWFVAELSGEVVGLLSYLHRHVESDKQVMRDVLFIDNIAVDEAHRGKGIGRQLLDHVSQFAREKCFDGVELQVNAKNAAAYEMYRKYGFTEKSINMELLQFKEKR